MRPFFISKKQNSIFQSIFALAVVMLIFLELASAEEPRSQTVNRATGKSSNQTVNQSVNQSANLIDSPSNKSVSKKIIIIGDSLTEGLGVEKNKAYPALLQEKMDQQKMKYQVVNSGVSGSTTASAVGRVKWVLSSKPDVVILALGANDGLRGVPVKESEKNLQSAIDMLIDKKVKKIILLGVLMPPNYGKSYTEEFKKMYIQLSKKNKVSLIPFILDEVAGNPQLNQADGIHPNEKGHQVIAEKLFPKIKGLL